MLERRKKIRNSAVSDDSMFIEIHHTFGQVKKSVYKIVEFDEYGLSFLMPIDDGYFAVGMPIKYYIIKVLDIKKVLDIVNKYYTV